MHLNMRKMSFLPRKCFLPLVNSALKIFFTQIDLALVLDDLTTDSSASLARLVVSLIYYFYFHSFHALELDDGPCEDPKFPIHDQRRCPLSGEHYQRGPDTVGPH